MIGKQPRAAPCCLVHPVHPSRQISSPHWQRLGRRVSAPLRCERLAEVSPVAVQQVVVILQDHELSHRAFIAVALEYLAEPNLAPLERSLGSYALESPRGRAISQPSTSSPSCSSLQAARRGSVQPQRNSSRTPRHRSATRVDFAGCAAHGDLSVGKVHAASQRASRARSSQCSTLPASAPRTGSVVSFPVSPPARLWFAARAGRRRRPGFSLCDMASSPRLLWRE